MLAALLIVFREVFEAGLIVGIVMAVTSGVPGHEFGCGQKSSGSAPESRWTTPVVTRMT